MSAYKIQYDSQRRKIMVPVDRDTYLKERQSAAQQQITEAARNGETFTNKNGQAQSVKCRLLQYNYSCLPNEDGTLAKSTRLSNSVSMDIDFPGEQAAGMPMEEWKKGILDAILARKEQVGALMLGDSATKGFHLVFRRHVDLTQEENLKWASDLLEIPFDECAKDHTRVLYEPSGNIYLLEDELFIQEEVTPAAPVTPLQCDKQKDDPQPLAYHGIPYKDIILKYWEMFNDGKLPELGDRNVKTFELAVTLRSICNYSLELLQQVIPQYNGFPYDEYVQTLENALKEPKKGMPYRMKQVLTALSLDNGIKAAGGTRNTPPPMPKKLPPLIKLLTKNVPEFSKPAVASCMFAPLSVHMHGVKFKYATNEILEPNFLNVQVARQSSGKSYMKRPSDVIIDKFHESDKVGRMREAEWKRKVASGKTKNETRPADILIKLLIDNLTDAVFNQRIVDANNNGEHRVYLCLDELEGLKKITSKNSIEEVTLIIRKGFDNALHGQERVGPDSVTGIAPLRMALNASTTPARLRRFFRNSVNDGTVSRLDLCTIFKENDDDFPVLGVYDDKFKAELQPYLERLGAASGLIECMQGCRLAKTLQKENLDRAKLYDSEAYKTLSFRANIIAFMRGMVLYIAHGYKWTKEIEAYVRWSESYDLWCKMLYFGDQLENEIREEKEIQQSHSKYTRNMLDLLPDEFTEEDYLNMRLREGRGDDNGLSLRQWKHRQFIEEDEILHVYHKTEHYFNRDVK